MMELYLPPIIKSKDTKFKKGHTPWNKGRKAFTTSDQEKQRKALARLEEGRRHVWGTRNRNIVHNQRPTCVYDLDGNFLGVYLSATKAAEAFGQIGRNVRACILGKRKRCGNYQFRAAKIEVYQGQKLVKKENITPYRRRTRWDNQKK